MDGGPGICSGKVVRFGPDGFIDTILNVEDITEDNQRIGRRERTSPGWVNCMISACWSQRVSGCAWVKGRVTVRVKARVTVSSMSPSGS